MRTKALEAYRVVLDVFLMEGISVEATSKREAIEKAKEKSRYRGEAELSVFEVTKD